MRQIINALRDILVRGCHVRHDYRNRATIGRQAKNCKNKEGTVQFDMMIIGG